MEFRLLGPLEVVADDGARLDLGPRKQRALLAVLLLHPGQVVSTDRIIESLWGHDAVDKERALWIVVSRLRSALEPDRGRGEDSTLVLTRDNGYELSLNGHRVDAADFTAAVDDARALLDTDVDAAAARLDEALALWRGDPLGEFHIDDFARHDVGRLEDLQLEALELRAEADLRRGQGRAQIADLEVLHDQNPLQERPVELLMRALYGAGRQADALRVFGDYRRGIGEELGIEPSPELCRLEEQILLHDAGIQGPTADVEFAPPGTESVVNPFRGLRPFREEDAAVFHGRDGLVQTILDAVGGAEPIVAVVGPSGSGKSSVVRAGVVPALRAGRIPGSDTWPILSMTPGVHPFAELDAAAVRGGLDPAGIREGDGDSLLRLALRNVHDDQRLVLVIDQFEELFTQVDPSTRGAFLDVLVTALDDVNDRVRVVVTLRADFYDRPLSHPSLGQRLSGNVVNVTGLSPAELRAAAVEPASAAGIRFDPATLATLITDVGGEPGSLPLFQYALTELFEHRDGDVVTARSYEAIGGVEGALGRRADELYEGLTADQRDASRMLFLRMVSLGGGTATRRRATAAEIISLTDDVVAMQAVIEAFGRHRLLAFDRNPVSDAPTVEVAHEALLTAWSTLAAWIRDAEGDLRQLQAVQRLVDDWEESGRHPDYLASGERLRELTAWRDRSPLALTTAEHTFLDQSMERRDEGLQAEAERARREARRLRAGLVAMAVLLVFVLGVSTFAFAQQQRADEGENKADALADEVAARALAARATGVSSVEPSLGLALAAVANDVAEPTPIEAIEALIVNRLTSGDSVWRSLASTHPAGMSTVYTLTPVATGSTQIAVLGGDTHSAAGESAEIIGIGEVDAAVIPSTPGRAAVFSSDGEMAFASDMTGKIWRTVRADGEWRAAEPFATHENAVLALAISPDNSMLVSADHGGELRLWDTVSGQQIGGPLRFEHSIAATAVSPDGSTVAVAGGVMDRYDTRSPAAQADGITGDPFGNAGDDGVVHLVDLETMTATASDETDALVLDLVFSHDGSTLYTVGTAADLSGRLRPWNADDLSRPTELTTLVGAWGPDGARAIEISPDGTQLFVGGFRDLWTVDLRTQDLVGVVSADTPDSLVFPTWGFAFSDQQMVVAYSSRDSVARWTRGYGVIEDSSEPAAGIHDLQLVDSTLVTASKAGVEAWNVDDLRPDTLHTSGALTTAVAHTSDGSLVHISEQRLLLDGDTVRTFSATARSLAAEGTRAFVGVDDAVVVVDLSGDTDDRVLTIEERESPPSGDDYLERQYDREFVSHVATAQGGSRLFAGSVTGRVLVADLGQDTSLRTLYEDRHAVTALRLNPDGTVLAVGNAGGIVHMFDASTLEPLIMVLAGDDPIESITFSPDGRLAVTGHRLGQVRVWRTDTGAALSQPIPAHDGKVVGAEFLDDVVFVTAGRDGTIRRWDLLSVDRACELVPDSVTAERIRAELGPIEVDSPCLDGE